MELVGHEWAQLEARLCLEDPLDPSVCVCYTDYIIVHVYYYSMYDHSIYYILVIVCIRVFEICHSIG